MTIGINGNFASHSVQQIYSQREAAKLFSVSIATWKRYVLAGRVPRPIQIGPRRIGWLASELAAAQDQWRQDRDRSQSRAREVKPFHASKS